MTFFGNKWLLSALLALTLVASAASADDASDTGKAPAAMLQHEHIVRVAGDPGDPVTLVMTIYTPDGPGPFPLAVMNHGSTSDLPPAEQPRYHLSFSVYYFLSRGYAVALPMMRGYAGSGGHIHAHGCDFVATGLEAAKDIRAVIGYLKQQPHIDGSRILIAGQSFGGWNTLAFGSLNEPDVKGLVSFAGGMKASDCHDSDKALITAAGVLGTRASTPSIWFFGDNDALFATPVWHAMFDATQPRVRRPSWLLMANSKTTHTTCSAREPVWIFGCQNWTHFLQGLACLAGSFTLNICPRRHRHRAAMRRWMMYRHCPTWG